MGSDGHPPPHPENVHHHHHHQEEPPPPPPPPAPAEEPPVVTIEDNLPPPEQVHHHQLPPQEETGCSAFLRGWFFCHVGSASYIRMRIALLCQDTPFAQFAMVLEFHGQRIAFAS
ncbi:hypothetical protein RHSIM_Rhsim12G0020600 [Rhododendron simsii]|uniref:Uncharacterized protein n=1 Tax=Rhododendron simsii TaxID=118357 RepID=A0A834L8Y1_RHOSS|nr:hypothetical protein RHSIM_Rhsim12G0020600 [Rhododendron simsii]